MSCLTFPCTDIKMEMVQLCLFVFGKKGTDRKIVKERIEGGANEKAALIFR